MVNGLYIIISAPGYPGCIVKHENNMDTKVLLDSFVQSKVNLQSPFSWFHLLGLKDICSGLEDNLI